MDFIKRSLKMAGRHKQRLQAGMFFIFIQNAAMLINFFAIYLGFTWMRDLTASRLWTLFGVLAASLLFNFLSGWLQNALIAGVSFTIYKDYRLNIGERLKRAPMGYFSEQSLSRILAAFTNVMKSLENYTQMSFNFSLSGISLCFFLLIGLFSMSPKIGMLALFCIGLAWLCVFQLVRVAKKDITVEHEAVAHVTDALVDGIRGIPVLRSFPALERATVRKVHARLRDSSEELIQAQTHFEKVFVLYSRLFNTVLNLSSLAVTLLACYLFTKGEVGLVRALTLTAAGFMLFGGLRQLENSAILLVKNPAHLAYLESVLDIPEIEEGSLGEVPSDHSLAFEHVTFGYDHDRPVIRDLSLHIPGGSRTAIVGPSGSGKTTIINLIARFYDPREGSIRLAGKDIRSYETAALLRSLSLVFQDVYLFSDTIENNIRFARPDATREEVIAASKRARCHDFIQELPQGYETLVGEGGSNLSGGERQRISIARALLKDAPIILLDEATSSVDPENEHEILSAIDELCEGHTVISIAHRLSTVRQADQILVIDAGRLVQRGTHDELVGTPGIYAGFIQAREKAASWSLTEHGN